jgi:hypothetical protein
MKDNNKNRKLKFIREKNSLRLGKTRFKAFVKFSDTADERFVEIVKKDLKQVAEADLLNKFKLVLRNHNYNIGTCGDDFIRNLKTALITLHN